MKEYILVTGGTGYIGSHTVVELQNKGYDVVIVDNLSRSNKNVIYNIEKITGKLPIFEYCDCCDYNTMLRIFNNYNISAIIHFAAYKCVGESVNDSLALITILSNDSQCSKATEPMLVTESGMVISVKLLQPLNVYSPIIFTPYGILILVKLLQSWNAKVPIEVTVSGSITLDKPLILSNAQEVISFIPVV